MLPNFAATDDLSLSPSLPGGTTFLPCGPTGSSPFWKGRAQQCHQAEAIGTASSHRHSTPPQGAVGKYPAFLECGMGRDPDGPDRVLMDMGEVGAHVTSSENIYIYRVGS